MAKRMNSVSSNDYDDLMIAAKEINKFNQENKIKEKLSDIKLSSKQEILKKIINENEIITVTGPAGTSKTFMAIYCALQFFINNKNTKIFLTKPIVEAGEELGFLPGELNNKTDPYLQSYVDLFVEMIGKTLTSALFNSNKIVFEPVAYMRGRNLIDSFIIVDECQNYNLSQLMTIVTRKHYSSKILLIGDYLQDDRFKYKENPFKVFNEKILKPIKTNIAEFEFTTKDIVRDKIIINIIENYLKYLNNE